MITYMFDPKDTIAVTNRHLYKGDYICQIRKIAAMQPKALILREKDLTDAEYEDLAMKVRPICEAEKVLFFVHSHADMALRTGCENIHLPAAELKRLSSVLSKFRRISVSCHSAEDVREAEDFGATQIVLGTIFETQCKPGLKGRGIDFVKGICAGTKLPVYAIGGIKPENLKEIKAAGAAGGCMMSGFVE